MLRRADAAVLQDQAALSDAQRRTIENLVEIPKPDEWALERSPEIPAAGVLGLAAAVLDDALALVRGRAAVGARHTAPSDCDDARAWIEDRSPHVFGFEWTCEALGLDATGVTEQLEHATAQPGARRSPAAMRATRYRARLRARRLLEAERMHAA
jgi:hypothetical protein